MLTEEAHHLSVGEDGVKRVFDCAPVELERPDPNGDVRAQGGIDLATVQKYINYWFSYSPRPVRQRGLRRTPAWYDFVRHADPGFKGHATASRSRSSTSGWAHDRAGRSWCGRSGAAPLDHRAVQDQGGRAAAAAQPGRAGRHPRASRLQPVRGAGDRRHLRLPDRLAAPRR
jgi:hypothetical protein